MIKLIRITDGQDSRLEHLVPLYEEAFCSSERRTVGQLRRMIGATPAMHFNMIESDGELCGLAVAPHMRNRKIGQQVLEHVETSLPGIRLLEVEPAEDELTARRVAFYRRNGYRIVDRSYVQPSYENFGDAAPLWIMGNDTPERLPEFIERIKKEVYRDPLAR